MADYDPETSLIINYLPSELTEAELNKLFSDIGSVANCKLMFSPKTRESMCYGFVTYSNPKHANLAIKKMDGLQLQGKQIKVSYARKNSEETKDTNVYIAGLPESVDDKQLLKLFKPYGEILSHKIIDKGGVGKGIAFVRYAKRSEAEDAINEMAGKKLPGSTVALTVKHAIPASDKGVDKAEAKQNLTSTVLSSNRYNPMAGNRDETRQGKPPPPIPATVSQTVAASGIYVSPGSGHSSIITSKAASVYVFGVPAETNETTLYQLFSPFGAILNVRPILDLKAEPQVCKGYAFVNFQKYEDACYAIVAMNGYAYEGKTLQVSLK